MLLQSLSVYEGTLIGVGAKDIGKYQNTMSKNTDTAFMISYAHLKLFPSSLFIHLKHVCTRNNLSHNFVRKRDKTLNLLTFGEGQHPFS